LKQQKGKWFEGYGNVHHKNNKRGKGLRAMEIFNMKTAEGKMFKDYGNVQY
jgi:hypothetical protein